MGYGSICGGGSASSSALNAIPVYITQTMKNNRLLQLPSKPVGAVVMYIEGCTPQLSSVAFNINDNVISWDAGSWFDVYLIVGEAVYFVYSTVAEKALHMDIVTVTAAIMSSNTVTLTATPSGIITLYIMNTAPLISGVSFYNSGTIVSWPPSSWLGTKLVEGENLHFVY